MRFYLWDTVLSAFEGLLFPPFFLELVPALDKAGFMFDLMTASPGIPGSSHALTASTFELSRLCSP
jgi:hypothetical protein